MAGGGAATAAGEIEAMLRTAAGHYDAGRLDDAAILYQRAERANPRDMRAVYGLAMVDIRRGRLESARAGLQRFVARAPGHFEAQHNLGAVCQELGRWPQAARAYRRAAEARPDEAAPQLALAAALAILGRTDEAVERYRQMADRPAMRTQALTRLAILSPAQITAAEEADLRAAAFDGSARGEEQIGALFAMGAILDQRGRSDEAFAAYAAGNRLRRESSNVHSVDGRSPVDLALRGHAESIRLVTELFDPSFIAASEGGGAQTAAPIFIVGMPRSGSSLIEQILASHPKVQAMGETGALSAVLDGRYPRPGEPMGRAFFTTLAEHYLAAIRARGWDGKSRFVDKTLENHLHVGMIRLMFPRATILHSVRDPIDTCLSCFRQLFASGNETLYDLAHIGAEYVGYRTMMAHWARVLPGRVIDVEHEALVASPREQIRWLVTDACGLAWDSACLSFHKAQGAVRTASAAQVRRPMFTSSVGRWRSYARHLGMLFEALGPYAPQELSPSPLAGEGVGEADG
jgi:hypothetical protein